MYSRSEWSTPSGGRWAAVRPSVLPVSHSTPILDVDLGVLGDERVGHVREAVVAGQVQRRLVILGSTRRGAAQGQRVGVCAEPWLAHPADRLDVSPILDELQ